METSKLRYVGSSVLTRGDFGERVIFVHKLSWGIIQDPSCDGRCLTECNCQEGWVIDPNGEFFGVFDATFGLMPWFNLDPALLEEWPAAQDMVEVRCFRYPTPQGMVEISPSNPIPPSQQKGTAAHTWSCQECEGPLWVRIVTQDALEGEIEVGPEYDEYEGKCPNCGNPFSLEDWDADEVSGGCNKGKEEFFVEISYEKAQKLDLIIWEKDGKLTATMPLYYSS